MCDVVHVSAENNFRHARVSCKQLLCCYCDTFHLRFACDIATPHCAARPNALHRSNALHSTYGALARRRRGRAALEIAFVQLRLCLGSASGRLLRDCISACMYDMCHNTLSLTHTHTLSLSDNKHTRTCIATQFKGEAHACQTLAVCISFILRLALPAEGSVTGSSVV